MAKPKKRRLDDLVASRGLCANRSEAQALILSGRVVVEDQLATKAGALFSEQAEIRLKTKTAKRFVSRAGEKLAGALEDLSIDLTDCSVLDLGSSTGGFTDCCLQMGAQKIYSVDVGKGLLAWSLRQDPRVELWEGYNIADSGKFAPQGFAVDWILADISFNSLSRLSHSIVAAATKPNCQFLLLVKPQFEAARSEVPDGGVIRCDDLRSEIVARVIESYRQVGLEWVATVESRVPGRDGNREVFCHFTKNKAALRS